MKIESQIANILLNVTFISTFIGIFFFTYAKNIEHNVVKSQSEFIADSLAQDISLIIDKSTAQSIAQNIQIPDESKADEEVAAKNSALESVSYGILAKIAIGGIVIVYLISRYFKLNFFELLKTNLIILFFVGITEYIFLTYISQNFISVDPNYIKYLILSKIKEKLDVSNTNTQQSLIQILQDSNLQNKLLSSYSYNDSYLNNFKFK